MGRKVASTWIYRPVGLLLVAGACLLGAGCGGSGGKPELLVFGASSLQVALGEYADTFPGADVRTSFAGSDQLAAQIRQGAGADVFASADTGYPAQLYREGLVGRPRLFAANRLVIAVPPDSAVSSLSDLAKPGTKLVIGDRGVPVGSYAHRPRPAAGRRARGDPRQRALRRAGNPARWSPSSSRAPTPASSTSPTPRPPAGWG
ncbi:MAG: molybdate ABC transporter substrate-binding protein [Solirubrobacterales bacterium]